MIYKLIGEQQDQCYFLSKPIFQICKLYYQKAVWIAMYSRSREELAISTIYEGAFPIPAM